MTDTKQSAIGAAAFAHRNNGRHEARPPAEINESDVDDARAAILAYLSALVEDEGAVEAVARSIMAVDEIQMFHTPMDLARAVLRTLLTRAQGESS